MKGATSTFWSAARRRRTRRSIRAGDSLVQILEPGRGSEARPNFVRAYACQKRDFVVQTFYSPDRVQHLVKRQSRREEGEIAGTFREWRAGEKILFESRVTH